MGTFVADPNKPVALVDCTGKHLVIIPAYASSRHDWLESASNSICGTASNSPRATTMHLVDESDTDVLASPNRTDLSPMLASSANLMMTALGNDIAPGGQVMGPPEAFYPSREFAIDSSFEDDDDDDPEAGLNVNDFIDFGDGSSDEEMAKVFDDDAFTSPTTVVPPAVVASGTPTPNRGESQQASSAERFLNHLDRGDCDGIPSQPQPVPGALAAAAAPGIHAGELTVSTSQRVPACATCGPTHPYAKTQSQWVHWRRGRTTQVDGCPPPQPATLLSDPASA
ncbi:uncharacterized protein ATNIH1004_007847 [Aspergillus tanneri]|uniref:Uncharacterized protein n=1 Tax=Aspergillus tanneri TaxID=1220188 RepID=A0A5M9MVB0_9EURO|nr:uncharacterized protein ATNIH1004_007847 [Aspergillus tanneri]KAA8646417.1 hypothetical protein ATNIH1004_007847 [Aspergillus tanneri]